jgi:hypothetical protein
VSAFPALGPPRRHNTTTNSIAHVDCCRATGLGCQTSQTWTPHRQDNLSVAGATVSSSASRTKKGQEKNRLAPYVPASTSVGPLTSATVGEGSRLGRKNRAKVRKTNGTSDDYENEGAHIYETSSWTCNSHCLGRCRGWYRRNTGRRRLLAHPLARTGWHRGGGMRGEREEVGWRI